MLNRYLRPLRGLAGLCLALLTATAWLAPLPARAQGGPANILWQRQLGTAAELIGPGAQMIRCHGGGYAIAADITDTTVAYRESTALITRLNEQGQLLWQRRIRPGGANLLAENQAGQFLISRGGSYYPPDTFPHLALLNANGRVLWDYAQLAYTTRLRTGNDGTFVGIARNRYTSATRIFKMDSVGADVWRLALPPAAGCIVGYLLDVQPVRGGYMVLQESETAASARIWEVIRVDEQGQEVNRHSLPTGSFNPINSAVGADSALLYAYGPCSRLTPQGVPLWTRAYPAEDIRAVCGQADGGMVLVAINSASPTRDPDLGLLKVAPDGTILKDTAFFRPFSYEQPRDIFLDDQGNYVICMYSSNGTHGNPVLVIFKVRAWATPTGLAPETGADADRLTVYPNPATDAVRLRGRVSAGARATLRDALGRVVRTYSLDAAAGDAPLSLVGLVPGLYLLTVTNASGVAARTWRVLKQ